MRASVLTLMALMTLSAPAFAAAGTAPAAPAAAAPVATPAAPAVAAKPKVAKPAPVQAPEERLDQKTEDMMKGLTEEQLKQFAIIRTAHGTLRAVDDVRASLERAVKSCTAANPDMKDEMSERFQSWKNAILPVVRQGESKLDKMILSQEFARPSKIRAYFKAFDDMVKAKNSEFTEVPVSSKEACKAMNKNMDKSQRIMGGLITETLGLDQDTAAAPTTTQE